MARYYELIQLIKNARTGEDQMFPFGDFPTRAEALKVAKRDFKGRERWVIHEVIRKVVAQSETEAVTP